MSELNKIKEILDGEIGKPLKMFLLGELESIRDINNVREFSGAQDQALEFKAQKKAREKLEDIFNKIMTMGDDQEGNENEYVVLP
jgi:hypothetical protein